MRGDSRGVYVCSAASLVVLPHPQLFIRSMFSLSDSSYVFRPRTRSRMYMNPCGLIDTCDSGKTGGTNKRWTQLQRLLRRVVGSGYVQKRSVRSWGWTHPARHPHPSTIFIRPFIPLCIQLRHKSKNEILDCFRLGQPWRVARRHRLQRNHTGALYGSGLTVVYECSIVKSKHVGGRNVPVGLVGEWREE